MTRMDHAFRPESARQARERQQLEDDPPPFVFAFRRAIPAQTQRTMGTSGSVTPTVHAIMPASIGTDIGCGVIAVPTGFAGIDVRADRRSLSALGQLFRGAIGLDTTPTQLTGSGADRLAVLELQAADAGLDPGELADNGFHEFGVVGGGDRFIEVAVDETDQVWLAVHAGSGRIGAAISTSHRMTAQRLTQQYAAEAVPASAAYLIEGTHAFNSYVQQTQWAQSFAAANREEVLDQALRYLNSWLGTADPQPSGTERINVPHNWIRREQHFGQSMWLSRERAVDAHHGVLSIVPVTHGAARYVIEGQGDRTELCSVQHGDFPIDRHPSRATIRQAEPMGAVTAAVQVRHVLRPVLTVTA